MGKKTLITVYVGIQPLKIIPIKEQTEYWNYNVGATIQLVGSGNNEIIVDETDGTINLTLKRNLYVDEDDSISIKNFILEHEKEIDIIKIGNRYKQKYGFGICIHSTYDEITNLSHKNVISLLNDNKLRTKCNNIAKLFNIIPKYDIYIVSYDE